MKSKLAVFVAAVIMFGVMGQAPAGAFTYPTTSVTCSIRGIPGSYQIVTRWAVGYPNVRPRWASITNRTRVWLEAWGQVRFTRSIAVRPWFDTRNQMPIPPGRTHVVGSVTSYYNVTRTGAIYINAGVRLYVAPSRWSLTRDFQDRRYRDLCLPL